MNFKQLLGEVFNTQNATQTIDQIEAQITGLKKGMSELSTKEKETEDLKKQLVQLQKEKETMLQQQNLLKAKQGVQKIPITRPQTPQQMATVSDKAARIAQT
jgi:hypothetical protein